MSFSTGFFRFQEDTIFINVWDTPGWAWGILLSSPVESFIALL